MIIVIALYDLLLLVCIVLNTFTMIRYIAYKKYLYYLNHFSSPKKILNILKNKKEFRQTKTTLKSYPYKYTFDPGNICNLRCPGCHTGIKHQEMITPSFMKLNDFKLMFNKVKDYSLSIALYNWGEPFLNKQLFEMISHANENKVGTTLHSNFNHFNQKMADEVIKSKLTHIYLSIDGASQELYSQYRVKGNLEKVIENVKMMVETKKRAKTKLPFITWKFLNFPFNTSEIQKANEISKKIGVNNFEVFYGAIAQVRDIYDQAQEFKDNPKLLDNIKTNCSSLWSSIYLGPDGTVFPCSLSFRESESFGNLLDSDFEKVWNNEKYQI